jgi:hypothetical protein
MKYPQLLMEKTGSLTRQTGAFTRHAQVLARRSTDDQVDWTQCRKLFFGDVDDAAEVRHVGVVMSEDRARERLDLGNADTLPPKRPPRCGCGFDPAE